MRKALDSYIKTKSADAAEIIVLEALALYRYPVLFRDLQETLGTLPEFAELQDFRAEQFLELERSHLIATLGNGSFRSCHPLVRDYFSNGLVQHKPGRWFLGHAAIFAALADSLAAPPIRSEEAIRLLRAIYHGCAAGKFQEALALYRRLGFKEGDAQYTQQNICRKFGFMTQEAAALFGFFDGSWESVTPRLPDAERRFIMREAASRLRSSGRLRDASRVFIGLLAAHTRSGPDLETAVLANRHLAEITLVLGDIPAATGYAEEGIALSGRTADPIAQAAILSIYGLCLHYQGRAPQSKTAFHSAERVLAAAFPHAGELHSIAGLRIWETLVDRREWAQLEERLCQIGRFRSLGPLPVNLGLVDEGLYALFQAISTPAADRDTAQSALQAALLAIHQIHLSNRREIYVKCLILCAKWCYCNGLQGNGELLLKEAKEEAASCEMLLMRIDAEVAMAAIQAEADGGGRSSIRLLHKLWRSTKRIGYRMRELELERGSRRSHRIRDQFEWAGLR